MNDDRTPAPDDFEDEIERDIEDKRDGVIAADATGMISSESQTVLAELREGESPPLP
jgi:hypothetical protein